MNPDLQSEGTGIRTPSPLRRFRQGPLYSPNRLVSQSATLKGWSEGPSTKPMVFSMISGSYFRRRRRLTILEPDETKFALHLTLLTVVCRLDHRRTHWITARVIGEKIVIDKLDSEILVLIISNFLMVYV